MTTAKDRLIAYLLSERQTATHKANEHRLAYALNHRTTDRQTADQWEDYSYSLTSYLMEVKTATTADVYRHIQSVIVPQYPNVASAINATRPPHVPDHKITIKPIETESILVRSARFVRSLFATRQTA